MHWNVFRPSAFIFAIHGGKPPNPHPRSARKCNVVPPLRKGTCSWHDYLASESWTLKITLTDLDLRLYDTKFQLLVS